ncbi:MAG: Acetylornithine deacetylase [Alphaproteobacteria bacterium MarineAlpha3_Bin2]|jgi:acetylornithine deacetylase|nr:MAG: Acetylornithine deacetylase [Alphaproteobacteria bacterium MarineAlpha3_Bin2]
MADLRSLDLIKTLIAFDTTSRESNLELIAFIQEYLTGHGVESMLVHNEDGTKANLYATIGDQDKAGVMLSGHTDVVPVDGQAWDTDPFQVTEKDEKFYGRGTADMKSFIAIALAFVPEFLSRRLKTPIHLAFSYDEEVGCIGVRRLIDKLKEMPVKPAMCIVGEPTSMQVVTGHKGKRSFIANVRGLESHSALAPLGVNAVEYAAELITYMKNMARRIEAEGPFDELYEITHTTVHTGVISGGVQLNIVPNACRVEFEFRYLANHDPDALEAEIREYAKDTLEPKMHAVSAETGIDIECYNDMPGLEMDPGEDVVAFVKALAGRNDHAKVAFGTEAGLFHTRVQIPTVVCGPGDIAVAHKPNEFIPLDQIAKGEDFMRRLLEEVSAD